jgi:hypothetical protein
MNAWERFKESRAFSALLAIFSAWWAYDMFTNPEHCIGGRRIARLITEQLCTWPGHRGAALLPLSLAVLFLFVAIRGNRT